MAREFETLLRITTASLLRETVAETENQLRIDSSFFFNSPLPNPRPSLYNVMRCRFLSLTHQCVCVCVFVCEDLRRLVLSIVGGKRPPSIVDRPTTEQLGI